MPFIKQQEVIPIEELRSKIEGPVIEDLKMYAEFATSDRNYVVQEILRKAMSLDKGFQAYRKTHQSGAAPKEEKRKADPKSGPRPVEKTA